MVQRRSVKKLLRNFAEVNFSRMSPEYLIVSPFCSNLGGFQLQNANSQNFFCSRCLHVPLNGGFADTSVHILFVNNVVIMPVL